MSFKDTMYYKLQFNYMFVIQAIFTSISTYIISKFYNIDQALELTGRLGTALYLSVALFSQFHEQQSHNQKLNASIGFLFSGLGALFIGCLPINYIYVSFACLAMAHGLIKPSLPILLGQSTAENEKGKAFKLFYAIGNVGALTGPIAFGFLLPENFKYAYFGCCALSIISFWMCAPRYSKDQLSTSLKSGLPYIGLFFLVITAFVAGFTYLALIIALGILIYLAKKDYETGTWKALKFNLLTRAFCLFLFIDQKYFLLQKVMALDMEKPFQTPFLYTLSGVFVITGVLVQSLFKNKESNPRIKAIKAYSLALVGYACLGASFLLKGPIWMWGIATVFCFSMAEISYLPYLIAELSSQKKKKILNISLLFIMMGLARYTASKLSIFFDPLSLVQGMVGIIVIVITINSVIFLKSNSARLANES